MSAGGWVAVEGDVLLAGGDPAGLLARPASALASALGRSAVRELEVRYGAGRVPGDVFVEQRRLAYGLPSSATAEEPVPVPEELEDMADQVPSWWKRERSDA